MAIAVVDADLGRPLASALIPSDAFESRSIGCLLRLFAQILATGCLAKIADSVVLSIAINVVKIAYRKIAMDIKPCKTMEKIAGIPDGHAEIAKPVISSDRCADFRVMNG